MGIAARELSLYVIRPTLLYLGMNNPDAEALLLVSPIWALRCMIGVAMVFTASANPDTPHCGMATSPMTRIWQAWSGDSPASTLFYAARIWS